MNLGTNGLSVQRCEHDDAWSKTYHTVMFEAHVEEKLHKAIICDLRMKRGRAHTPAETAFRNVQIYIETKLSFVC